MRFPRELSAAELAEVENLSGLHFTFEQICLIVCPPDDMDPGALAVMRGALKMEAEVRRSIFEHATNGSSPAQALAVKFIDEYRVNLARA